MKQGKAANVNQSLSWGQRNGIPILEEQDLWAGIRESRNTGIAVPYISALQNMHTVYNTKSWNRSG